MTLVVRNRNFNGGLAPQGYGLKNILEDFFDLEPLAKRPIPGQYAQVSAQSFEDRHEISIAAPGLKKSDFNIQLKTDKLTVSYEACEAQDTDDRRTFSRAGFSKVWTVARGTTPEDIRAKYNAGVLKVIVARPEDEVPAEHSIKIN